MTDRPPTTLIIGPDTPWIKLWCRYNDVNFQDRNVHAIVSSSATKGQRAESGDRLIVLNRHRIVWDISPMAMALVACGFEEYEDEVGDKHFLRDIC